MKACAAFLALALLCTFSLQSCQEHVLSGPTSDTDEQDSLALTLFEPTSGEEGTIVYLRGVGFGTDTSAITVHFGEVITSIVSLTDTELVVRVPAQAHTSFITVNARGKQVRTTSVFRIPFDASTYRRAIVEVSGVGIEAVQSLQIYGSSKNSWVTQVTRRYDSTISFTRTVESCRQGCDTSASTTIVALCCPEDDFHYLGTSITLTVDTLLNTFRSIRFLNYLNPPSDTAAGYFIFHYEAIFLYDAILLTEFSYIEATDGSLVCTVSPDQFNRYLRVGGGPISIGTEVKHIPDWGRDRWIHDTSTYTEFYLNSLSPPDAFIRITLQ